MYISYSYSSSTAVVLSSNAVQYLMCIGRTRLQRCTRRREHLARFAQRQTDARDQRFVF